MNMRLIVISFLLLLLGCYQQKRSGIIEAELVTDNLIRLQNGTNHNILVPLYNGTLPFTEQAIYSLNGCNLVDIESITTELVMNVVMDTLRVGSSKTYHVNFFNTNTAAILNDSQLVFKFSLYDQPAHQESPYSFEATRALAIASFRDEKGEVKFSKFSVFTPSITALETLHINICR